MERRRVAIHVMSIIVLVLCVTNVILHYSIVYASMTNFERYIKTGIIHGISRDEIRERQQAEIAPDALQVHVNENIIMNSDSNMADLRIENIAANHFGFIVTITRDDTKEILFKSPLLTPNHYIEKAPLLSNLQNGRYNCTATVEAYPITATDATTPIGTNSLKISIIVGQN